MNESREFCKVMPLLFQIESSLAAGNSGINPQGGNKELNSTLQQGPHITSLNKDPATLGRRFPESNYSLIPALLLRGASSPQKTAVKWQMVLYTK